MRILSKKYLRRECARLTKEYADSQQKLSEARAKLDEYHKRENEISQSLVLAREKSSELLCDLRLQYALEIERLKLFQAKWTNAYEELRERYHFEKDALSMENVVVNTAIELEKQLANDFGLRREKCGCEVEKQFKSESERLLSDSPEMADLVQQLRSQMSRLSGEKGFDLDEALNPSETIGTILKDVL